jgi:hypothetical protein
LRLGLITSAALPRQNSHTASLARTVVLQFIMGPQSGFWLLNGNTFSSTRSTNRQERPEQTLQRQLDHKSCDVAVFLQKARVEAPLLTSGGYRYVKAEVIDP